MPRFANRPNKKHPGGCRDVLEKNYARFFFATFFFFAAFFFFAIVMIGFSLSGCDHSDNFFHFGKKFTIDLV
ncbi:MAG TPA: hypothetical protein VIJ29_01410 [Candidatus Paceibacterota bacterium]